MLAGSKNDSIGSAFYIDPGTQQILQSPPALRAPAGGIVAVGLQGGDHAGEATPIAGGILEELLDEGASISPMGSFDS